ncbi:hypothetical protein GCM10017764_09220 [Sphingobacterium griseoflavum]|uniref:Uncharacterized protein n=1 Tax=Sphingobacterium griseoflavum TaxID=1474952 RepID=A0ABQ3HUP7_9SPHI|nr:hypothetical protein GCM10017764_09220 [Sphingobacterium griseoflavum]
MGDNADRDIGKGMLVGIDDPPLKSLLPQRKEGAKTDEQPIADP